jgi:hypothetical protein
MGHLYPVTVTEANDSRSTEKLLLRALIVSVLLHLLLVGLWREGKALGWWRNFAMPHWIQSLTAALMPLPPKKLAAEPPPQTQLTFVEVDPALAAPAPPKKPVYQGAKNTVAANREIKEPSERPDIDGLQEKYLKTTENAKPQPIVPAPAPSPAPTPPAAPTHPPAPPIPQNTVKQNAPQKTYTPGDLAMSKPSEKAQEGKTESEASEQPQPQPQPPPVYQKPRTLAEARARNGSPGQRTRQRGGVAKVSLNDSLDVVGTPLGDYMAQMVGAVQARWNQLLQDRTPDRTGKVVLHFRLLPDGSITDMKMEQNEVGELLEATCELAVIQPAPYGKWPREMRLSLPNDYHDIRFTFYYENY